MSALITRTLDWLRATGAAHPNKTRLVAVLLAYLALRRLLVRRKVKQTQLQQAHDVWNGETKTGNVHSAFNLLFE